MMLSSDEICSPPLVLTGNEVSKAPSYDDLVEENEYLRSEVAQLYDQIANPPKITIQQTAFDCAMQIKALDDVISDLKHQNELLTTRVGGLTVEAGYLQSHSEQQAIAATLLENQLRDTESELHTANAELLQILPLRMKLSDAHKKLELIKAECLGKDNEILTLTASLQHINKKGEQSALEYQILDKTFNNLWEECQNISTLKKGTASPRASL